MSDIGFWLAKKYAIMQQQANNEGRLQDANATKGYAEARNVDANSAANRAQAFGAADAAASAGAQARAHAALIAKQTELQPQITNSEIGKNTAQAGLFGTEAAKNTAMITHGKNVDDFLNFIYGRNGGGSGLQSPGAAAGAPGQPARPAAAGTPGSMLSPTPLSQQTGIGSTPASTPAPQAPVAPVGGGPGAATVDTGAPVEGMGDNPDGFWHPYKFAHGTSNVPAPCHGGMVPGHDAGISNVGDTHSVGGQIYQGGQQIGTPGFAENMGTHAITDRSNGSIAVPAAPRMGGMLAVAGSAAGQDDVPAPEQYKKGTGKVAGKGDGTKDKTLSMLAPGEAVLNKAAAEDLGRDTIDALNAAGAKKMGLDQQPNQPADVPLSQATAPGHKGGTSNVRKPGAKASVPQAGSGDKAAPKAGAPKGKAPPKAAAKADSKAPAGKPPVGKKPTGAKGEQGGGPGGVHPAAPAMLQALSRMMGAGGAPDAGGAPGAPMGAPPTGLPGGAPAPMPMPQPQQMRGMM